MAKNLSANIISEKLLSQVDEEEKIKMKIYRVINHRVGLNDVPISEINFETENSFKSRKRTTCVWKVCVKWKYGSKYWVVIKDVKYS